MLRENEGVFLDELVNLNLKNLNEVLKVISFPHFQNRISGLTDVNCRTEEVLAMRKGTDALGFDRQPIYDEVEKKLLLCFPVCSALAYTIPFIRDP